MRVRRSAFLTACAANAGYIASRNGSATAAPRPRSTVRRESMFHVSLRPALVRIWNGRLLTIDGDQDRKPVVAAARASSAISQQRGRSALLQAAPERVGHQLLGEIARRTASASARSDLLSARWRRRSIRPSGSVPDASISKLPSFVRQAPAAS